MPDSPVQERRDVFTSPMTAENRDAFNEGQEYRQLDSSPLLTTAILEGEGRVNPREQMLPPFELHVKAENDCTVKHRGFRWRTFPTTNRATKPRSLKGCKIVLNQLSSWC